MARKTKADLEARVRELEAKLAEAEEKLAHAEAVLATLRKGQHIDCDGKRYVPVSLTREQHDSVYEGVHAILCRGFGNGEWLSGNSTIGGVYQDWFMDGDVLPGFGGFIGKGTYDVNTGFYVDTIYGLVQVPKPCWCKRMTMQAYRCEVCDPPAAEAC
jgi:hypothetical protein